MTAKQTEARAQAQLVEHDKRVRERAEDLEQARRDARAHAAETGREHEQARLLDRAMTEQRWRYKQLRKLLGGARLDTCVTNARNGLEASILVQAAGTAWAEAVASTLLKHRSRRCEDLPLAVLSAVVKSGYEALGAGAEMY